MSQGPHVALEKEAEYELAKARWEQRPLHRVLSALMAPCRLSTPQMGMVLLILALVVGLVWRWASGNTPLAIRTTFLYLLFVALDWALLALLPRLKLSFGPVHPPLLALAVLRLILTAVSALLFAITPIGLHLVISVEVTLFTLQGGGE